LNAAGILVVAAAGHSGPSCSTVSEPAAYENVLSVGALDTKKDNVTSFSSRGPIRTVNRVKPDISAPGKDILSAMPPNRYGKMSGTSMACPHISGVAALMWSALPTFNRQPAKTMKLMTSFARHLAYKGYCGSPNDVPNNMFGHGVAQTFDAIKGGLSF